MRAPVVHFVGCFFDMLLSSLIVVFIKCIVDVVHFRSLVGFRSQHGLSLRFYNQLSEDFLESLFTQ